MPRTQPTHCPHCSAFINGATFIEDNEKVIPEEGDVSVCLYCARVSIYLKDGTLRKPTDKEHELISDDPDIFKAVSIVKRHGPRDPGRRSARA